MNSTSRICKWDNIKFFLMISVVVGHFASVFLNESCSLDTVFMYTLSFHMPLFIFISGLFTKSYNTKKLDANKIIIFIILGFLYKLLNIFAAFLVGRRPYVSILSDSSAPWYLFALAAFMIITYTLRNIKPLYVIIFSVILALITGYDVRIGDYLSLSRIIVFYPFFYIGYCLDPLKIVRYFEHIWVKIVSVIGLLAILIVYYINYNVIINYRTLFTGNHSYYICSKYITNCGANDRILMYLIFIFMGVLIIGAIPNKQIPVITKFGSRTLQVYILHRPILTLLQFSPLVNILKNISYKNWDIMWMLIGIVLTFVLSLKIFEYPFKIIMNNYIGDKNK